MTTRRKFILGCAGAAAAAGLGPASAASGAAVAGSSAAQTADGARGFARLLGQTFQLHHPEHAGEDLTLVKIDEGVKQANMEQFTLVFQVRDDYEMPADMGMLEHRETGAMLVTFQDRGQGDKGHYLSASFSHFV